MEHGSQDVIQFPKEKEKLVITDEMILDFVEQCRKQPVKENPENMARFLKCYAMAKELAGMLPGGSVLPVVADPTFHHAMSVKVRCKRALFSGTISEKLKELVLACNAVSVDTTLNREDWTLSFEVFHIWEAIKDD